MWIYHVKLALAQQWLILDAWYKTFVRQGIPWQNSLLQTRLPVVVICTRKKMFDTDKSTVEICRPFKDFTKLRRVTRLFLLSILHMVVFLTNEFLHELRECTQFRNIIKWKEILSIFIWPHELHLINILLLNQKAIILTISWHFYLTRAMPSWD